MAAHQRDRGAEREPGLADRQVLQVAVVAPVGVQHARRRRARCRASTASVMFAAHVRDAAEDREPARRARRDPDTGRRRRRRPRRARRTGGPRRSPTRTRSRRRAARASRSGSPAEDVAPHQHLAAVELGQRPQRRDPRRGSRRSARAGSSHGSSSPTCTYRGVGEVSEAARRAGRARARATPGSWARSWSAAPHPHHHVALGCHRERAVGRRAAASGSCGRGSSGSARASMWRSRAVRVERLGSPPAVNGLASRHTTSWSG